MTPAMHSSEGNLWKELDLFFTERHVSKILVVTGQSSYSKSGAEAKLGPILEDKNITFVSGIGQNPKAEIVISILEGLGSSSDFDIILAVGGGSVIDTAKLIKAYWQSPTPIYGHLQNGEELIPSDLPLVAIPTTAGSGSEATHFAVVYLGQEKFSVAHEKLQPDLAIVIPSLLASLPKHTAASSSMDALCQGIESYWSIYSTEESRDIASEAIKLAWQSIEAAVNDKDPSALENIAKASHLAGRAINITKTTAPHAVSYALTLFYGLNHGHAVGLLIPHFLVYNSGVTVGDCLDPRGVAWVQQRMSDLLKILGFENVNAASAAIINLMKNLGLETNLAKLGVESNEDIETIIINGFNPQRVNNNPRKVERDALRQILLNATQRGK